MNRLNPFWGVLLLSFFGALVVSAQEAGVEWSSQINQSTELYQQGEYERAGIVAQKALDLAEGKLGSEHPDVAVLALKNLAKDL